MPMITPQAQQGIPAAPAAEQAEQMLKERFSQTAYSVLFSKFPDLAQNVVTFKILETDGEKGNGVGAFIILQDQLPFYIPVVLVDGQLKPLEMFYYKPLNIFLPLNKKWIDEIGKMTLEEMGESENAPDVVPKDMSVRNLVLPPMTTGRFGYASVSEENLEHGVNSMIKAAEDHSLDTHPQFLNILQEGNRLLLDGVKIAFEQHPQLLQKLASVYGVKELIQAFNKGYAKAEQTEKIAEKHEPENPALKVLTIDASPEELQESFGDSAKIAFQNILKHGYDAADNRDKNDLNRVVKVEGERFLQEPGPEGGWYRLYFVDTNPEIYYVIPWPVECTGETGFVENSKQRPIKYLAIRKDTQIAFVVSQLMGEPVHLMDKTITKSPLYKILTETSKNSTKPKPDVYGCFIVPCDKGAQATAPTWIEQAISDNGKQRYISAYGDVTYILDDDPTRKYIQRVPPATEDRYTDLIFLPANAKWIPLGSFSRDTKAPELKYERKRKVESKQRRHSIIRDPRLVTRWLDAKLQKEGAQVINVRSDGSSFWRIEDDSLSYPFKNALEKVALQYHISVPEAEEVLKEAQQYGRAPVRLVKGGNVLENFFENIGKEAQAPMPIATQQMQQIPAGTMPPGGMLPPAGGQQQQPAVDPTDLAITEAIQNLQQQNQLQTQEMQAQAEQLQQATQQQAQQTQQLVGVLQGIQQRSAEIGQATGGMIPPEAMEAPAAAAEMLAPTPPPESVPPPMPIMDEDTESVTPEMVAQQINPFLVDQAEELQDNQIFDTAAISMLATSPILQNIVSIYVPNMEKCLDNLGRVLLTLWLTEEETKKAIGDEAFISLEDKLRAVFKSLGDIIINLSQNAISTSPEMQAQQGPATGV